MSEQRFIQGDTWQRTFIWCNPTPDGKPDLSNPVDITGYTAKLQVRREPGDAPVLALTSDPAAGLVVDGPAGTVRMRATPAQTSGITVGRWLWDVQIETADDRHTLDGGVLIVREQIST